MILDCKTNMDHFLGRIVSHLVAMVVSYFVSQSVS